MYKYMNYISHIILLMYIVSKQ